MRTLLMLIVVLGLWAADAGAHAVLEASSPTAGSVLAKAPAELRLTFSERIEPRFSTVEITAGDGANIRTERARADPARPNVLTVRLPPLAPGRYQVRWRAISADSHKVEGSFAFEVRP